MLLLYNYFNLFLHFLVHKSDEAKSLGLPTARPLLQLYHVNLAEGLTKKYSDLFFDPDQVLVDNLKVFPDVVLAGLPGQAKDNQVVSLVGVVVVVILVVNLKKILIRAIQPCSILLQYIF